MYVEDLFLSIHQRLVDHWSGWPRQQDFDGLLDSDWYRSFIPNVASHIIAGNQLSTNQSKTILKLIAKVRRCIVRYGLATADDISSMLTHPEHRRPLYTSIEIPREVRHLGSNFLGFRYKQNDLITKQIKQFGHPDCVDWLRAELANISVELIKRPYFDWTARIWVVPLFRHNFAAVCGLIRDYRFHIDDVTASYLQLAWQSGDQPSSFALSDDLILANVCDNPLLAGWITEIGDGLAV